MPPLIRQTMVALVRVHDFDHKKNPYRKIQRSLILEAFGQLEQLAYVATTDPQELRKRRV
jgi:hypothetical protein